MEEREGEEEEADDEDDAGRRAARSENVEGAVDRVRRGEKGLDVGA